jgi:hypothetical protein
MHLLTDSRTRAAVEQAELFANGITSMRDLRAANRIADEAADASSGGPALVGYDITNDDPHYAGSVASVRAAGIAGEAANSQSASQAETVAQLGFLRDVFGNPFRPVAFNPEWRTDTAVTLARTMYESRDFNAMPILADALQDAGCDNADVLDHCRDVAGGGSGEPVGGFPCSTDARPRVLGG